MGNIKKTISDCLGILNNKGLYEECQLLKDLFEEDDNAMCEALGCCMSILSNWSDPIIKAIALRSFFFTLENLRKTIENQKETIGNLQMALLKEKENEQI